MTLISDQGSVIVLISGDIPKELPVEVHSSGITGLRTITITITSRRPLELSYNTEKITIDITLTQSFSPAWMGFETS